jgi:hypothetical protein
MDVSLKSGEGEQRDDNKRHYNQFEVSSHAKENNAPTAFQFIQDNISIGILFTIGNATNGGDY